MFINPIRFSSIESPMVKVNFNPRTTAYPMPVTLVGTKVDGKPNFMAVAWFTKVNSNPPMMVVSLGKKKFTGEGIKENKFFSINLPGTDLVTETDYCGIVSGRLEDKTRLFEIFYGEPANAPMIQECPINYDLKLAETVELPGSNLFIGEIVGAYVDEDKRKDHMPDVPQMNPFMLVESPPDDYFDLGSQAAEAFSVGKKLKLNP
jgi:flavin reductase (DIM6/NTAB) family NADH-FMN oxidoreductase RutF